MNLITTTTRNVLFVVAFLVFHGHYLSAQNELKPKKYSKSAIYAGVEVGSKGVKLSILEIEKKSANRGAFDIIKDSTINTDFISFTPATFTATLTGLKQLYDAAMNDYSISTDRIFTVISSGVKNQAEKEKKSGNVKALIDSFQLLVKEPNRQVTVIDVAEEARLSHLGIVPETERYNTFLIDIGSGNTKGGYFPNGNNSSFKLFQINWGTKSITNLIQKRNGEDKSIAAYARESKRVLGEIENADIVYAVNASGSYRVSDHIAFSGGTPWAVASLLHPEQISSPVVVVTYDEVEKFIERLTTNYVSLSAEEILKSAKGYIPEKDAITKTVKTVHKVFDQQSLIGGASLLLKIMRQFEPVHEKKQFYLVKNGSVGWVSAFVSENKTN
jgi:hypothetical protein